MRRYIHIKTPHVKYASYLVVSFLTQEVPMSKLLIISVIVAICSSCTTYTSFAPYGETYPPNNQSVKIIPQTEQASLSCIRIGEIHIFDPGLAINCGYDHVLNKAKKETNARGGNTFKITRVSTPSFWTSSCYRIRGEVLLCD